MGGDVGVFYEFGNLTPGILGALEFKQIIYLFIYLFIFKDLYLMADILSVLKCL